MKKLALILALALFAGMVYYQGQVEPDGSFHYWGNNGTYYHGQVEPDGTFYIHGNDGTYKHGWIEPDGSMWYWEKRPRQ